MADKDFANTQSIQIDQEPNEQVTPAKPLLIATLALMFAIVCFAIGFYMGEKYSLQTNEGNKQAELLDTLQNQQKELAQLKKEAKKWRQKEAQTSQVGELTFYNELPKQSVVPEPIHSTQAHAQPKKTDVIKTQNVIDGNNGDMVTTEEKLDAIIEQEMAKPMRSFRIQLASFKDKKDSENLVSALAKVGVEALIQRVDLAKLGVRYRVNTTPYQHHYEAVNAREQVKEKFQISGIIISE